MAIDTSRLQKFYIAYYGRPADPEGLAYWAASYTKLGSEIALGAAFGNAAQAEFAAIYGSSTSSATAFINKVYNNLFGRNVDSEGLAYWQEVYTQKVVVDEEDPSAVRAEMVMYILDGAQGSDATIVTNKTTAAAAFTAALDTADEQVAFVSAVLSAPGANAGTTTLAAVGATTTAAEITALVTTGVTQAVDQAASAAINEIALSASATVRTFTGTAGKDKFVATLGDSLKDGDKIVGSLETDTLALRSNGNNTDGNILTTMDGVESVEINLRSATTIDTAQWSGVSTIAVTGVSAGAALTLTNVKSTAVDFDMAKAANVTVSYEDNTGTDTIDLRLGSGISNTATFNGNNEIVNITVSGAASLTLDASAETINVMGSGNLTLDMGGDAISGINAATLNGSITATISAGTNVSFVGGSTGDTLNFNNALTSGDVLNGGAGTDTLNMLSIASAAATTTLGFSGVSNFETLGVNASGIAGTLSLSNPAFSTINVLGATAETVFSFAGLNNGTTVTFDNGTAVSYALTYTGTDSVDVGVVRLTTAGAVLSSVNVSGADTITIAHQAATSEATTIASARVGNGTESITLVNGGSGNITISTLFVSGTITDLNLRASGHGGLTVTTVDGDDTSSFDRLKLSSLTVDTAGSSTLTVGAFPTLSGLNNVDITAAGSSTVLLAPLNVDRDANIDIDLVLTGDADLGAAGNGFEVAVTTSGTLSYVASIGSGDVVASAINAGASGQITDLSVTITSDGTFTNGADGVVARSIGPVTFNAAANGNIQMVGGLQSVTTIGGVTVTAGATGTVNTGNLTASGIGAITITAGLTAGVTLGTITAHNTLGLIGGTLAKDADLLVGIITVGSGSAAGIDLSSVGASATVNVGDITVGGSTAAATLGNITVSGEANASVTFGTIAATADVGNLAVTVGSSGTISIGTIVADAGSVGNVTLVGGVAGSVTLGAITASAENVGAVTITAGSAASIGDIRASGSIGNISVTASGASDAILELEARTLGTVTLNIDGLSVGFSATPVTGAYSVGDISVDGSAVSLTFGSAAVGTAGATIGSITITGSGSNSVNVGSAAAVGTITVTGSGITTIDMSESDVGTSISLRGSANNLLLGDQGGYVELQVNSGVDAIVFTSGTMSVSTVASGVTIRNFDFSGTTDTLHFGGTAGSFGLASAAGMGGGTAEGALTVVTMTAVGTTIVMADAAGSAATSVIVIATGIDAGSIVSALAWIGSTSTYSTEALNTAGQVLVMWYNASGQETQLHLVGTTANFATTFTAANSDYDLLARFADDIRLYSGTNFGSTFNLAGD